MSTPGRSVLRDPARIGAALALVAIAVVVPGAIMLALALGASSAGDRLTGFDLRIKPRPDRSVHR